MLINFRESSLQDVESSSVLETVRFFKCGAGLYRLYQSKTLAPLREKDNFGIGKPIRKIARGGYPGPQEEFVDQCCC